MLSMRQILLLLLAGFWFAAPALFAEERTPLSENAKPRSILVYIGTYTGKKSQGIYVCRLDPATGALTAPELAGEMINPSWVAIRPGGKYLYAAGEFGPYPDAGAIRGFAIGPDAKLTELNTQGPGGHGPCHVVIDPSGRTIVVANYNGGAVASLQIAPDGKLSPPDWVDQHPDLGGGEQPHAHGSAFDSSNHFALSCDAGIDRIYVYRFDAATGALTPNDPPFKTTTPGTHPRHLTFSPDGKYCYSSDEAGMGVSAFSFDAERGILQEVQTISTRPKDFTGHGASTEIVMHPTGRFLYASNLGDDNSIVAYAIDSQTGKLTLVGHTSTQGQGARSFGVDPTGHWLIAGNQNSDSMVEFAIDQSTGNLSPTGTRFELGAPVCFQFLEVPR